MTPEPNADLDPRAAGEWLDGLAGRSGDSASAQEGASLRAALAPSDRELASPLPAWDAIVAATQRAPGRNRDAAPGSAANESTWKRVAMGGVAAVVLAAGVWWTLAPHRGDVADGMRGTAAAGGAMWKTDKPAAAASELATRLRAIGARVKVTLTNETALLNAECGAASAERVNQELAALETAVDANCRLSLRIMPFP